MSVVMELFKPVEGVTYLGHVYDRLTRKELNQSINSSPTQKELDSGYPKILIGENANTFKDWFEIFDSWCFDQEAKAWSDGNHHSYIDLQSIKKSINYREWLDLRQRYKPNIINSGTGYAIEKIPVTQIKYAQGWFFKRRFFNYCYNHDYGFVTTSKKKMIKFLYRYIDFNYGKKNPLIRWYDGHNIQRIVEEFIDAWEDGMIFTCLY